MNIHESNPVVPRVPLKILIVDDHVLFSEGLGALLKNEADLQVVGIISRLQDTDIKIQALTPEHPGRKQPGQMPGNTGKSPGKDYHGNHV